MSIRDMFDPLLVAKNLGGPGVSLYAFMNNDDIECTFQFEELTTLNKRTADDKRRIRYIAKNGAEVGQWLQSGDSNADERALFIKELAEDTGGKIAGIIDGVIDQGFGF